MTAGAELPELVDVTLAATARAARDFAEPEIARAKAQLKVSLLSALETPGGRIERNARQILAWGRVIPAGEVIDKVDAVTVADVRAAAAAMLEGAPTLAAIGPIRKLPALEQINWKWVRRSIYVAVVAVILLPIIAIGGLVLCILAAIASNKGEQYKYPVNWRIIK